MKIPSTLFVALFCLHITQANALPSAIPGHDPAAILQELKDGNRRFATGKTTYRGNESALRESLVATQAPDAIVLGCSDSRVPPELVFDRNIGDIFTVRVAGNILNNENIASVEYAVEHLGSRLIVVMGHESCGAVKAALDYSEAEGAGSPSLNILISDIRTNLGSELAQDLKEKEKENDTKLRGPVKTNVSAVAATLLKRSKIVKDAVQSGRVRIVKAMYELGPGRVDFWE